jgi:hypothetical protein
MYRSLTIYALLLSLLLHACNRNQAKTKIDINKQCDSCCLKKLAHFADTLNIDTSKLFDYYFNEKNFSLGNCKLKKFRGNASLKSSLVLFWLKIDNVYLKKHWGYAYSEYIGGLSKALLQLVYEFYFLATKTDPQWIEGFSPAWTNTIIKEDPSLLKNKQIREIFNKNQLLRRYPKKK